MKLANGILTPFAAALLMASGLGTFGCDQDTRVPRAEFRRPTGLSYLQRPSEFNCPATPLVDGAIIDGLTRNQRQLSNAVRIDSTDD
ncbi:MAG: hypothetical protein AAGK78_09685, partial [Planctomycetota bacterium]